MVSAGLFYMKHKKEDIPDLVSVNPKQMIAADIDDAYKFCKKIALSHYENFPVGSILIPKKNRPFFYAVYAFSRLGDDIGDEYDFQDTERIDLLNELSSSLSYAFSSTHKTTNPILSALVETLLINQVEVDTPLRLLEAFRRDVYFKQPDTLEDIYDYCHYSANPVGELVLGISGELRSNDSEDLLILSDKVCTGLQMINFWQDISRDIKIGRVYIPKQMMEAKGLSYLPNRDSPLEDIEVFETIIQELTLITRGIMDDGKLITKRIRNSRLRAELSAIISSAMIVLDRCAILGSQLLFERPQLKKTDIFRILPKVSVNLLRA
jgi:squalene synthase HpnC